MEASRVPDPPNLGGRDPRRRTPAFAGVVALILLLELAHGGDRQQPGRVFCGFTHTHTNDLCMRSLWDTQPTLTELTPLAHLPLIIIRIMYEEGG